MQHLKVFAWQAIGMAALSLAGCAEVKEPEQQQASPAAAAPRLFTLETYEDDELPGTQRTIGPVDEEHLIVPIPDDWIVPPRNSRWLARAQFVREEPYPMIFVTGGEANETDAQGNPIEQLDESNLQAYAKQVEEELAQEHLERGGSAETAPEVSGLKVGPFYGVMYVRPAVAGGKSLERLMIITIEHGRKYEVELRALRGTLRTFRPQAYAVAARLKIS